MNVIILNSQNETPNITIKDGVVTATEDNQLYIVTIENDYVGRIMDLKNDYIEVNFRMDSNDILARFKLDNHENRFIPFAFIINRRLYNIASNAKNLPFL